jgi:hypothetical protein
LLDSLTFGIDNLSYLSYHHFTFEWSMGKEPAQGSNVL